VEENVMMRNTTAFIRGRHSLKVGLEMRSRRWKPRRWRNQGGWFTFSYKETGLNASTGTGNAFASFLLGWVDSANISTPQHVRSDRPYYAWFVQDDIKVTQKLTVNAGLRYDLDLPPREQYDRASTFDLTTPNPGAGNLPGALIFAGTGSGLSGTRTFEDTYYRGISPRLGIAYQISKVSVVRSGYGISHSTHSLLNTHLGFSTTQTFDSPDNGNSEAFLLDSGMPTNWPKPPFINPAFGNNNNVSATIRNDSARMPMTQVWRPDLQHELPGGTVVEVAYVGTRGTHLGTGLRTLNQVDAKYLSLGSVLTANITSAAAQQAGIKLPYPGFKGTPSPRRCVPLPTGAEREHAGRQARLIVVPFHAVQGVEAFRHRFSIPGLVYLLQADDERDKRYAGSFGLIGSGYGQPALGMVRRGVRHAAQLLGQYDLRSAVRPGQAVCEPGRHRQCPDRRVEPFPFNRAYWGSANSNVSSSDFGKVTSAGPGRFVQIGLKLHF
jgi:hypothetical protein